MKKYILLAGTLLFSFVTLAQDLDPFIGMPMRWPTYFDERAYAQGGGYATLDDNLEPIVYISRNKAHELGSLIMGAILQHEYCHHELEISPIPAVKEADADCCAAEYLVNGGIQARRALQAIINYQYSFGCSYHPETALDRIPTQYPCGVQRAQIMEMCADRARR